MGAKRTVGPIDFAEDWPRRLVLAIVGYAGAVGALLAARSLLGWDGLDGGVSGGVFGGLVAVAAAWTREADYRSLSVGRRAQCREVVRTGMPSGDRTVDAIAYRRLRLRATNSGRVVITIFSVVLAAMVVVVVAAALRRDPRFWSVLPLLAVTVWSIVSRWESPRGLRERRDRVRDSLPPILR